VSGYTSLLLGFRVAWECPKCECIELLEVRKYVPCELLGEREE
jgi:hypothetical protein